MRGVRTAREQVLGIALLLASSTAAWPAPSPPRSPSAETLSERGASAAASAAMPAAVSAMTSRTFDSVDAVQGVAVGERYVYALSGRRVSRHAKASGVASLRSKAVSAAGAPIVHLDSGVVHAGRLYAAHSDWPRVPTRSSVEAWDAITLEHVGSHPFGTRRGAFTWLDRYAGSWWGTFTDYGRVAAAGETAREPREITGTRLVEMDDGFGIVRSWTFPRALSRRFAPMSNSGGSWGPDGRLYVTGHDRAEAYVIGLPEPGGVLDWVATVALPDIEGQGIAWDRSDARPTLYGIARSRREIVRMRLP